MIAKASKLERAVAKWEASKTRAAEKQKAKRLYHEAWAKVSAQVKVRDGGRCRVCGVVTTRWGVGDPRLNGCAHHIVMRSKGRDDSLSNVCWCCRACHSAIHEHHITVTGTSDALIIAGYGCAV